MAVAETSARERKTLRLLGRWLLWAVLPLVLLGIGSWEIVHRAPWLGSERL